MVRTLNSPRAKNSHPPSALVVVWLTVRLTASSSTVVLVVLCCMGGCQRLSELVSLGGAF